MSASYQLQRGARKWVHQCDTCQHVHFYDLEYQDTRVVFKLRSTGGRYGIALGGTKKNRGTIFGI
jgi:hypothetical protein